MVYTSQLDLTVSVFDLISVRSSLTWLLFLSVFLSIEQCCELISNAAHSFVNGKLINKRRARWLAAMLNANIRSISSVVLIRNNVIIGDNVTVGDNITIRKDVVVLEGIAIGAIIAAGLLIGSLGAQ